MRRLLVKAGLQQPASSSISVDTELMYCEQNNVSSAQVSQDAMCCSRHKKHMLRIGSSATVHFEIRC